jgi:hypothetical protein
MGLTRTPDGKTKPRGFYLPELPKPEYFSFRAFEKALDTNNWGVACTMIRYCTEAWQTAEGKQRMRELLALINTQAPSEAHLPPVLPE